MLTFSFGLSRRSVLRVFALGAAGCAPPRAASPAAGTGSVSARLADLERRSGGRLGVAWSNAASRTVSGHRQNERFPMCSTFKLPLVAAVLQRVDAERESLDRVVRYDASALLEYAPVTRDHVQRGGMTVEGLCEASVSLSDNTAANLLLDTLGGPPALTSFFRSLGDAVSRLDRTEPLLNTALPGDERDTTTPAAMLGLVVEILVSSRALSATSQKRLLGWLEQSPTGRSRLRAGLPGGWRAGDKTGTGENGATNDVVIAWPPAGGPLVIAAYSIGSPQSPEQRSETLAEVARIVTTAMG